MNMYNLLESCVIGNHWITFLSNGGINPTFRISVGTCVNDLIEVGSVPANPDTIKDYKTTEFGCSFRTDWCESDFVDAYNNWRGLL